MPRSSARRTTRSISGSRTPRFPLSVSSPAGERLPHHLYYDAEFKTKGFTLKAPKIRVKDTPSGVKVTVLAKVK